MTKKEFFFLADKYSQGTCSAEEKEQVEAFCEKVQLEEISARWSLSQEEEVRIRLLKKIMSSIDKFHQDAIAEQPVRNFRMLWRVAASVILVAGVSWWLSTIFQREHPHYITKAAPRGQRVSVTLEDGSVIRLNAESAVTFPESFESSVRKVELQGEAFFEVAKDSERPFIIETGDLTTTVLGTSFNVQAYPDIRNIKVTVATGKVKVSSQPGNDALQEVTLLPGQQAAYNTVTKAITLADVSPDKYLAWKDDIILLERVTMGEATEILSRWYNAEFVFENEGIKDCVINGEFKSDELSNILENLKFLTSMEYQILPGNRVIISGDSCQ